MSVTNNENRRVSIAGKIAVRSGIAYTVNSASETKSTLIANDSGWEFSVALRYIYAHQHEMKKR